RGKPGWHRQSRQQARRRRSHPYRNSDWSVQRMTPTDTGGQATLTPQHLGLDTLVEFVEASLDGIVVLNCKGEYLYANPVACEIMGYSLDELVGRDFRMNFPQRLHQAMLDEFKA